MQEQITSQLVEISPIYQDVVVRENTTSSSSNANKVSTSSGSTGVDEAEDRNANNEDYSFTKLLKKIYEHMEQVRYRMQKDTYKQCTNNEWQIGRASCRERV